MLCFAAHGELLSDRAGIRGNIIFIFTGILAAQISFKAAVYPKMVWAEAFGGGMAWVIFEAPMRSAYDVVHVKS